MGTIGCLTAFRSIRTIVIVKDHAFFGRPEFDMGNVGSDLLDALTVPAQEQMVIQANKVLSHNPSTPYFFKVASSQVQFSFRSGESPDPR